MKFVIKNTLKENVLNLMRRIGYYSQKQEKSQLSFIRPLERSGYPRFHVYLKKDKEELILNLHLDQKKPVYKGASAHSGEYEGKVVETETERIKQILQ
jgi:hypothetical protein